MELVKSRKDLINELEPATKKLLVHKKMEIFEDALLTIPGCTYGNSIHAPLEHQFGDGIYLRTIFMSKGTLLTTRIHKFRHPYFIMKGDVSILTDEGEVRIKAPYSGMTERGTKRLIYVHEDTIWSTVHPTSETDTDLIEEQLTDWKFENYKNDKVIKVEIQEV